MDDQKGLTIDISPETARGQYANLAIITHSSSEFILDFASLLPGMPQGKAIVGERIIMTPEHAKRLLLALQDNVGKYEASFGTIKLEAAFPLGGMPSNGAKS